LPLLNSASKRLLSASAGVATNAEDEDSRTLASSSSAGFEQLTGSIQAAVGSSVFIRESSKACLQEEERTWTREELMENVTPTWTKVEQTQANIPILVTGTAVVTPRSLQPAAAVVQVASQLVRRPDVLQPSGMAVQCMTSAAGSLQTRSVTTLGSSLQSPNAPFGGSPHPAPFCGTVADSMRRPSVNVRVPARAAQARSLSPGPQGVTQSGLATCARYQTAQSSHASASPTRMRATIGVPSAATPGLPFSWQGSAAPAMPSTPSMARSLSPGPGDRTYRPAELTRPTRPGVMVEAARRAVSPPICVPPDLMTRSLPRNTDYGRLLPFPCQAFNEQGFAFSWEPPSGESPPRREEPGKRDMSNTRAEGAWDAAMQEVAPPPPPRVIRQSSREKQVHAAIDQFMQEEPFPLHLAQHAQQPGLVRQRASMSSPRGQETAHERVQPRRQRQPEQGAQPRRTSPQGGHRAENDLKRATDLDPVVLPMASAYANQQGMPLPLTPRQTMPAGVHMPVSQYTQTMRCTPSQPCLGIQNLDFQKALQPHRHSLQPQILQRQSLQPQPQTLQQQFVQSPRIAAQVFHRPGMR